MRARIQKWNATLVVRNATGIQERKSIRAAELVASDIRRSINRPNPTGKNPSRPGEPPKKVSGLLQGAVQVVVRRFTKTVYAAVTVAIEHARALEFGTSKMRPRPFVRPAWVRNRARIKQILGGSGKVRR